MMLGRASIISPLAARLRTSGSPRYRLTVIYPPSESCRLGAGPDGHDHLPGKAVAFGDTRTLEGDGAWAYRRLFWESGLIGQVLYLEAEAAGVRSTGMGCYFDDFVHQLLGMNLADDAWQSLYHFTVGGAVEDERLTTLPAYGHLPPERVLPSWRRP